MFREFGLLILDYASILKRYFISDMVVPAIITLLLLLLPSENLVINDSFVGHVITLLGILAGFNITALTVITTTSGPQILKLKSQKGTTLNGRRITLFEELYIFISYSVLASFIIILFETLGYIISIRSTFGPSIHLTLALLNVWAVLHILFLNIRNITLIYFSFLEKGKKGPEDSSEKIAQKTITVE